MESTRKSSEKIRRATNERLAEGTAAEMEVSKLLTNLLPEGYLVLNDIKFKYGNLDHVVIRPDRAIFLLETKACRGQVSWNGKQLLINGRSFSRNPICQINRSIPWVRQTAKRLFGVNPWIVAVLVFPNARVMVKRSVKRVNVMSVDRLIEFLRSYQQ